MVSRGDHQPARCGNARPSTARTAPGANRVLVGWMPCSCQQLCGGHRTYHCRTCDAVIYRPEHRTQLHITALACNGRAVGCGLFNSSEPRVVHALCEAVRSVAVRDW